MALIERQHPIIEQIRCGDGRFGRVKLSMSDLAIGVHIGLLIDPPDAFDGADIEGILTTKIAGPLGGTSLACRLIDAPFQSRRKLHHHVSFSREPGLVPR